MADGQWHQVAQGEWLSKIAVKYNFTDWETIWNHPNNSDLCRRRSPNILYPGDMIFIPAQNRKSESGPTEKHHRFQIRRLWDTFQVQLFDSLRRPIANKSYVLEIGSREFTGDTDENGIVREEKIDPQDRQIGEPGKLTLPELGLVFNIALGSLNPGNEQTPQENAQYDSGLSGIQMRLANLGYKPGNTRGTMDSDTQSAISMFQTFEMKLPAEKATGELTDDTRNAIMAKHTS